MSKKNKNSIKCDFCNLRAIFNFQKVWVKFTIDKKGRYKKDKKFCSEDFEQPINENNIHLCKMHLEKFIKEEI